MDCVVHEVAKSWTQLSVFHLSLFPGGTSGKKKQNLPASAGDVKDVGSIPGPGRSSEGGHGNHSSILAWKIPWTEEPGELQSIGSQRVGHD